MYNVHAYSRGRMDIQIVINSTEHPDIFVCTRYPLFAHAHKPNTNQNCHKMVVGNFLTFQDCGVQNSKNT